MPPPFTGIFSDPLYAMPARLHSSGRQAVVTNEAAMPYRQAASRFSCGISDRNGMARYSANSGGKNQ